LLARRAMHDVGVTIAVHVGDTEAFPPLPGRGQARIEAHKAHGCRRSLCISLGLTRPADEERGHGQTSEDNALEFQGLAVSFYGIKWAGFVALSNCCALCNPPNFPSMTCTQPCATARSAMGPKAPTTVVFKLRKR